MKSTTALYLIVIIQLLSLISGAFLSPLIPARPSGPLSMVTKAEESGAIAPTGYFVSVDMDLVETLSVIARPLEFTFRHGWLSSAPSPDHMVWGGIDGVSDV